MDGVSGDQTIKLVRHDVTASPDRGGYRRVSVDVRMATAMSPLEFWFDVPESHADRLSRSGNPWLVMMLPMAMASGQAIEMPCPVDPHLVDNLNGLMQIWHAWSPRIDAGRDSGAAHERSGRIGRPARPLLLRRH